MKNKCVHFIFISVVSLFSYQLSATDKYEILGNGGRGLAEGYPADAIDWYQKNMPILPIYYIKQKNFVPFEPLLHYADQVNWSLFPLKNFKKVSKHRWIRVPAGTKIKRNEKTGIWQWPIGAETAKLLGGSVKNAQGKTELAQFELRLARKIRVDEYGKSVWAMATYIKDNNSWKIAMPPHLELTVPKAVTQKGKVHKLSYSLTSPEGCMTCHSRGSYSHVDYKRGDEFVYGANEELLTGKVKIRLSEYLASDEISKYTTELDRSEVDDWIQLEYKDKAVLERNRKSLAPLFE